MYSLLSDYLGGAFGAFMWIFFVALVIGLITIVIKLASLWRIFTKANEPGWAAIVPIYNKFILVKVARLPVYYFIALYIPFLLVVAKISTPFAVSNAVGIAVLCLYCFITYNLCKQFGKGFGYAAGMILLPFIFYPMLAFGDSVYQEEIASSDEDVSVAPAETTPTEISTPVESPVVAAVDQAPTTATQ